MNPRTFLPARRVPVAAAPAPGDPAPGLNGVSWSAPTIIAFLRHVGCPFAEATFRELRDRAERQPRIRFVAVSHAPGRSTSNWCAAVAGGPGRVELLIDDQRLLYGRWGLGQGSLGHFLGRRSLTEVARLTRRGIRNRHPVGTRWQTAGTFGVGEDGIVHYAHLPSHAGDLPDLDEALAALDPGQ